MIGRRADPGPRCCAHKAADEGVAQTVSVLPQFHGANVLPLNGPLACAILIRDRCVGDAHERSGMFLRIHFDDLNLLTCLQAA